MKVEIKVPAMGESISEATVGNILKPAGSRVEVDDEIMELETEKVNQVLYAQQAGIISLNVKTGDTVMINQTIGTIDTEGQTAREPPSSKEAVKKVEPEAQPPSKPPENGPKNKEPAKEKILPAEKGARQSKEAFVAELDHPTKSVPSPKQIETANQEGRPETRRKMTKIRQVIARRLVEAQQTTAMLTTFNEVDMTQVIAIRERYKEAFAKEYGVKLGFMSFFVKACVDALTQFPDLNSYIDGDEIVHREYYDIGIAVGTDRGLVVPVVRNCNQLSFAEIEKETADYAKKAREGTLTLQDLQGGGFTITNGGVYGSLLSTPILNPPQSGILGMHKISKRAVVVDDQIVIRSMMYLALSYDHRIVDGKEAVSFLVYIKNCLEDPARFLLEIHTP